MAYDEGLAQRVRECTAERADVTEEKMFGGLCFLVGGNMAAGTGRALRGMVYVGVDGLSQDAELASWVARGVDYAASLPAQMTSSSSTRKMTMAPPGIGPEPLGP